jgi:RNA polymerase sigma factor (sigma-70 family)
VMTGVAKRPRAGLGLDFDEFFASVYPRARAVARRIVGTSLAEDVAVEGLARAFAQWKTVAKMEHPEAWVMRVVTNLALDEVRRKRAYLTEIRVRDVASDFVIRDRVVEALRSLSKRQQEVVVLRYIVDLPESDVARILGMTTGTVGTHLHRALSHLRTYLTDEESR